MGDVAEGDDVDGDFGHADNVGDICDFGNVHACEG